MSPAKRVWGMMLHGRTPCCKYTCSGRPPTPSPHGRTASQAVQKFIMLLTSRCQRACGGFMLAVGTEFFLHTCATQPTCCMPLTPTAVDHSRGPCVLNIPTSSSCRGVPLALGQRGCRQLHPAGGACQGRLPTCRDLRTPGQVCGASSPCAHWPHAEPTATGAFARRL